MIVDAHAHILTAEPDHLRSLLKSADHAGVNRICVSSLSRTWDEFPSEEQLREASRDVLAACSLYPDRFIGGVYVSAEHIETSLAVMEEGIGHGPCRFVKLWISQFADDPRLEPIIERAIAYDASVLAHAWVKATGNMTCESTHEHILRLATRHPRLRLCMAHYCGRWEEAARAVSPYPNISVDLSGGEPEDGIIECLLKHLPAERLFFGSDAPGRSFTVQMSKVLSANIGAREKALMLGENILRWLHV